MDDDSQLVPNEPNDDSLVDLAPQPLHNEDEPLGMLTDGRGVSDDAVVKSTGQPASVQTGESGLHVLWNAPPDTSADGIPRESSSTSSSSSGSSSSSDSSSSSSHELLDDPSASLISPLAPTLLPERFSKWHDELEGVAVRFESHGKAGDADAYNRYIVQCPNICHHRGKHKCQRKRNGGPKQCFFFGPCEPLAFLGVWLRHARLFDNKVAHSRFVPKRADIIDYMREHGMPVT